ncbi:hypothetical protein [Paracoccus sp. IB05]|uniref:hypothetical protein n=1 Tax=Paracoccus sp. IB05 TaxID=2779367 RepID=UPI0018E7D3C7|nr:hypothetical protein [Paracoccus sp. IB05]MBJ2153955.1 hypothetical protein [Paracoccus sp. IB05]
MTDDLIAAMEVRDGMPAPSTVRSTTESLVRASMKEALALDVLRARDKLARLLAAKPSVTEAGRQLGLKLGDAVWGVQERSRINFTARDEHRCLNCNSAQSGRSTSPYAV